MLEIKVPGSTCLGLFFEDPNFFNGDPFANLKFSKITAKLVLIFFASNFKKIFLNASHFEKNIFIFKFNSFTGTVLTTA